MPPVTIYTTPFCGYCMAAKRLLGAKGVAFVEIDVAGDAEQRAEMMQRAKGGRTVPQIFRRRDPCRRVRRHERARARRAARRAARGLSVLRAGLVQLCSGDDPAANLPVTEALVREAAAGGATLILTPECTNLVSASRARQAEVLDARGRGPDARAAPSGRG